MAVPSLKRSLGFSSLGASLVVAVALSACGDDGGTTQPEVIIQPSTFSTIVSTTAAAADAPAGGAAGAGGTVAGTQVYEVQSGDFLSGIAADYGIPPESIANFNQWDDGLAHVIQPGQMINIPPGAQVPGADDEDDEDDSSDEGDTEEDSADEETEETQDPDDPRCADGSRQGTYTIEAGDFPGSVAESLDVTVDQLNEANASTSGYRAFIVGAEILVPCGDEDE